MEGEIIGAIKIKDGLFIGDQYAAKDLDFIVTNKVTHIINCAGRGVENCWESFGVVYLTFNWTESETQALFDTRDVVVNEIYNFVEEAVEVGESVLIHSMRGQSRACCVIAAYFMKRFNWTLYKTLEFLNSRRPNLEIRANFFHQLTDLESRLIKPGTRQASSNWTDTVKIYDSDEILITNTFLNAKNAPIDEHLMNPNAKVLDLQQKINWKEHLAHYCPNPPNKTESSKKDPSKTVVRSILKGSKKLFKSDTGEEVRELTNKTPGFNGASTLVGTSKPNRSSKSLLGDDGRFDCTNMSKTFSMTMGTSSKMSQLHEKNNKTKTNTQPGTLARSSSASTFEREGSTLVGDGRKVSTLSSEKQDMKALRPNGSSQLSYNSYMLPQHSNSASSSFKSNAPQSTSQKLELKSRDSRDDTSTKENREFSYTSAGMRNSFKKEENNQAAPSSSKRNSSFLSDNDPLSVSLSYTAMKPSTTDFEKKNSLEAQRTDKKAEDQAKFASSSNKISDNPYTPSSELDQYTRKAQLSQSRETNSVSPLLKRDENVTYQNRGIERNSKSTVNTKTENSQSHASYLNGLFSSKLSSDTYSNQKGQVSEVKNASSQANQINSRLQYQNYLSDSLKDIKTSSMMNNLAGTNKFTTPFNTTSSTEKPSSTAILGQRNVPIKATYEIAERPKSAVFNSKTSNPLSMNDTLSRSKENQTRPSSASSQMRSFSPSVKSSKPVRKESPVRGQSPQLRQRSSSPVQMKPYNTVYLGPGPFKPKWKF